MSYQNFIKVMELAPKCKFYTTKEEKQKKKLKSLKKC